MSGEQGTNLSSSSTLIPWCACRYLQNAEPDGAAAYVLGQVADRTLRHLEDIRPLQKWVQGVVLSEMTSRHT